GREYLFLPDAGSGRLGESPLRVIEAGRGISGTQHKRYCLAIVAAGAVGYAAIRSRSSRPRAVRPAHDGPRVTRERSGRGRNIGMATTSGATGGGLSSTDLQI